MYSWLARRTLVGLALISVFSISSTLPGQSSKVERDVAFVRALAKDLGFISLAQEETNRLQRVYEASNDFQHVAQLGIEISPSRTRESTAMRCTPTSPCCPPVSAGTRHRVTCWKLACACRG